MAGKQPAIPLGYDIYLDVFFRLNTERINSQGVIGSIPATKILEYLQWLEVDNINEFIEVITRVDVAYVDAISKQLHKQMQSPKG